MANTQRRLLDKNGNQFIPMNVEGQGYTDAFMTTPKIFTLVGILLSAIVIISYLASNEASFASWIFYIIVWLIISVQATRYIIFEEKFYYRMYKELQGNEITTPAIAWNIASIKNTEDGAILTYTDAKVGVIVKIDRDTITGKDEDFEETHYDAISNFYNAIVSKDYSIVQLNLMETAGKDPRLSNLDKLSIDYDNENIKKLVDLQIGHIKSIANQSLFETDYILIYTNDVTKIDNILTDVIELMFIILDGAYIGYKILNQRDIIEMHKESFGVKYFDTTDASLNIYKDNSMFSVKPFNLTGIVWDNGETQELDNKQKQKVRNITANIINERIDTPKSLKELIYVEKAEESVGVDFTKLGQWSTTNVRPTPNISKTNSPNNQRRNTNKHVNINNQHNSDFKDNGNNDITHKTNLYDIDFDDIDDELIDI